MGRATDYEQRAIYVAMVSFDFGMTPGQLDLYRGGIMMSCALRQPDLTEVPCSFLDGGEIIAREGLNKRGGNNDN